ncbi:MAG: molybdate ABC transporter substrate-binding protein [Gammaproteobacteria bacterium]|nr:molybdate ABC transporter substrate-binding protein [Gammaproteobacteria bacterium]|tara:strand:- start:4210 stop:4965 length:756 start_codon:yes stop_codon:yes gene_type:complete
MRTVQLLSVAACLLLGQAHAEQVMVAVAANFSAASEVLEAEFEAASGHSVETALGSSGRFFAQITNGAPFQVFLSADQDKPAALEEAGFAVPGSRFTYAIGSLVLWSADSNYIGSDGQVLAEGQFERLAIANPRLAPYGIAAVQVLDRLNIDAATRSKIILGENIAQTYQFVSTGNAELGFVALSQVVAAGRIATGSGWIVPTQLHEPIRQDAVLLEKGAASVAAQDFLEFLRSSRGQEIIASFGYRTEED